MYEKRGRLLCSAEGTPIQLFGRIMTINDANQMPLTTSIIDICVDNELGFAKDRTISRSDALSCFESKVDFFFYRTNGKSILLIEWRVLNTG